MTERTWSASLRYAASRTTAASAAGPVTGRMPSEFSSPATPVATWPMKSRLSVRRRAAASTGAVPSASAERSCSIACARSSNRSKLRLIGSGRTGPIAFSTPAAADSTRGVDSRTAAAVRCACNAASRPSSTACDCSRSAGQPLSAPSTCALDDASGPRADLPASISFNTCSSRVRDASSASKAGAEPRTAAPACSGMFCASDVSAATCSRSCTWFWIARPDSSSVSAASTAAASATPSNMGCSRAASNRFVMSSPFLSFEARALRTPQPAGTAGSRAGS